MTMLQTLHQTSQEALLNQKLFCLVFFTLTDGESLLVPTLVKLVG